MSESQTRAAKPDRDWTPLLALVVVLLLAGLPLAVWLDLRQISERMSLQQAEDMSLIINDIRQLYAEEVVGRVLQAGEETDISAAHNFRDIPGAIPIPATFSIELGQLISARDHDVRYAFVSDLPFRSREPYQLDAFQQHALAAFRAGDTTETTETSGGLFNRSVRVATPIRMGATCVACHNSHPESPKTDWQVGDVRGIQETAVQQRIAGNLFSFKFLLGYLGIAAATGTGFIWMQRRQSSLISAINRDLAEANNFLASVSLKIAKYLSPQVYKSIFSGQKDVTINTERKKLTVFFSDIKGFTATTERLQPEDLTSLLNDYLTEMSNIALQHGGTLDKFIGDAILVFFGDPETKGVAEDARSCLRMAMAMQARLTELEDVWRRRGMEEPFRVRMGINTGYCNVGNFGSEDRMDYTIIGAEANLAARLQSIAEPGSIVLSYETYVLVRDMVDAEKLAPIEMKGISRTVVPYTVRPKAKPLGVIEETVEGLNLVLNLDGLDRQRAQRMRTRLEAALATLDARMRDAIT
jgi:adenylate cyclase